MKKECPQCKGRPYSKVQTVKSFLRKDTEAEMELETMVCAICLGRGKIDQAN